MTQDGKVLAYRLCVYLCEALCTANCWLPLCKSTYIIAESIMVTNGFTLLTVATLYVVLEL